MKKHCMYCKTLLQENDVVDVCRSCGLQVWGRKMFDAIILNMENARDVGDLYQGSVSDSQLKEKKLEASEEPVKKSIQEITEQDTSQVRKSKQTIQQTEQSEMQQPQKKELKFSSEMQNSILEQEKNNEPKTASELAESLF